jgi:hypothetical protein
VEQVVAVKLVPDAEARAALVATLRICNEQANRIAQVASGTAHPASARQDLHLALPPTGEARRYKRAGVPAVPPHGTGEPKKPKRILLSWVRSRWTGRRHSRRQRPKT